MRSIRNLCFLIFSIFLVSGCSDDEIKARELGFINSRDMRFLQAKGFNTKEEFAKHSGFSGLEDMKDAEAHYIGNASKYYEYLKVQKEIKRTRPENEQLDILLSQIEQIDKIKRLITKVESKSRPKENELFHKLTNLDKNIEIISSSMRFSDMQCKVQSYSKSRINCTISNADPEIRVIINLINISSKYAYQEGTNILLSGKIINVDTTGQTVIYAESNKISKLDF